MNLILGRIGYFLREQLINLNSRLIGLVEKLHKVVDWQLLENLRMSR